MGSASHSEADGAGQVTIKSSGPICTLTLNRPSKLNALTLEMLRGLHAAQMQVAADAEIRAVILRGSGRAFCAGADLKQLADMHNDHARLRGFLDTLRSVVVGFEQLPQVVIGAVHGVALTGGLELLLGCDLIIAERSAQIADHHMQVGLVPGGGSTQRLERWIGAARARDLLLTGRWLSAEEAERFGLVSRVVGDGDLGAAADALAGELAGRNGVAMREVKRLARLASETPLAEGLELEIEGLLAIEAADTVGDALRSMSDFRAPGT